ncbi:MAG TPA: symmetrical bis(5'-nucleosyl)-tetraphosphatase [Burkholderiaceae bacterium]|nr:symmetrical bis(5'-nucleosyl)-tetraphosphatase [Burkholderiaceae bacterium]
MAHYLIGDIQGCNTALGLLLEKIDFSPSRDTLFVLGDLVNRGPDSLATLERIRAFGNSAKCLLGNHDLNLLAVAYGVRQAHRKDTLNSILESPKLGDLMYWLKHQKLAMLQPFQNNDVLMVHAGVLPTWTASKTIALANEVELVLQHASDSALKAFLHDMYGDEPQLWRDDLQGTTRLRVIVNVLTRMRFCMPDGTMEFKTKDSADAAPKGYLPWFDVPNRATQNAIVAFGHWSTLGWLNRTDVYALDGGCVWGGYLNALKLSEQPNNPNNQSHKVKSRHSKPIERIRVQCLAEQIPQGFPAIRRS